MALPIFFISRCSLMQIMSGEPFPCAAMKRSHHWSKAASSTWSSR